MPKLRLVVAGALLVAACSAGERSAEERATEDQAADTGGRIAIAIPDSAVRPAPEVSATGMPAVRDGDTVVTGIVREVGAEPLTQLVLQAAGAGALPVAVRGELRAEIANLLGAEVRVWGAPADNQPPPPQRAIEIAGYEIVSVNGVTPAVGTLVLVGDDLVLAGSDTLQLRSPPEVLRSHVGAKVWIVGDRSGDALSVQSFGVIRPADR